MDKTYFLEVDNVFDNNKLIYRFTQPYSGIDTEGFGRTVIKQLLDLFKYYGVDINSHISSTSFHLEDGEGNSRIYYLDVNLRNGTESKSHIRRKVGVLKKVQPSPIRITVHGKDHEYHFITYNITDQINENANGLYLFTMMVEDDRPNLEFSHSIIKFDSVEGNNKEVIAHAKANGALHFLYYDCDSEYQRQLIIEDIKNGENYKYQLTNFPETEYFPELTH